VTDPGPGSLAAALAELQTQLPHVTKDATNPHFRSRYATLEGISAELLPIMGKLGLSFSAKPTLNGTGLVLEYVLRHAPSGEHDSGEYPLPVSGSPQQIGSAITYARRYCLCAVTGLAPDEDDDANAAEDGHRKPAENPQKPRTARGPSRPSQQTVAQQQAAHSGSEPPATPAARDRARGEVRAVAAAGQPGRPAARTRGPVPAEENIWQGPPPEERHFSRAREIMAGREEDKTRPRADARTVRRIQIGMSGMRIPAADRHEYARAIMGWDQAPASFSDLYQDAAVALAEAIEAELAPREDEPVPLPDGPS